MNRQLIIISISSLFAGALGACDGGGPGTATIFVEPEETITDGLAPGPDLENIKDGWTVTYTKFVLVLGNLHAQRSADGGTTLSDPRLQVIDLQNLPQTGLILTEWKGIADARWDRFGYDQGYATAGSVQADGTSVADFAAMVAAGNSLWVAGTITKDARTVTFDWPLKSGVAWNDCGPEMGDKGFAVPAGGTVPVKATIHGDHWFFNNFPEGEEITDRLAEWIATVDTMTGADGSVSIADLQAVAASAVFPSPTYRLSNPLGDPINTAFDYVVTQARTIGHQDGEGECSTLTKL
jgi:hypothetical protein